MTFRTFLLTAGLFIAPVMANAAAPAPHVRGTITSIKGDTVEVKTDDGKSQTVMITDKTRFVGVTKASLDQINKDSYIGTATKDVGNKLVALEVVIFPEAMRGAGDGHYDWDPLPDSTLGGGSVSSTMTNGNVSAAVPAGGKVNSSMTNGNVASASAANGAKQLTVTYKGGEQQILVPPNVPVVMLQPGKRDELKDGAAVFATMAKDSDTALSVAVGLDGVKPPM